MVSPFVKQSTRSFKFAVPGDTIDGEIVAIGDQSQQPKFNKPGEYDFWPSGDPIMQIPVTWQTGLNEGPDENGNPDDGRRTVFFTVSNKKGGRLAAMQDAIREAGASDLEVGAKAALKFVATDPESKNMDNPRKLYAARYAPPAAHGGAFAGTQDVTPAAATPPAEAHGAALREQYTQTAATPPAAAQPPTAAPAAEKDVDAALVKSMLAAGADDATVMQVTGISAQALGFVKAV